jgi:hypothetical protein
MAEMSTFQNTCIYMGEKLHFLHEITPELVGLEKNVKVQKLLRTA